MGQIWPAAGSSSTLPAVSRLIVLHQGAIGDFLLTLSVIQAVREMMACDDVTAIAGASSARLAAGRSAVDAWLSPEDLGLYRLFCRDLPLGDRLAGLLGESDHVLNFLGGPTESIHERLEPVVGGQLASIDPRPAPRTRSEGRHITSQWADDLRERGWQVPDPTAPRIHIRRAGPPGSGTLRRDESPGRGTSDECDRAHRERNSSRVLIHPGSGGRAKCWPLDRFFALADSLSDLDVTWMLGPAEVQEARRVHERDESLLVEPDLAKAADQMAGFDLYVGNDSGMTHLAAAIGLPTVAIFGATDPRIWRPLGEHVAVVAPEDPAQSLDAISPDDVRAAILTISSF